MTFCFLKATAFGNFSFLADNFLNSWGTFMACRCHTQLSLSKTSREHTRTVCRKQLSLRCVTRNVGKLMYFEMPAYSFPTSMAL